MGSSYISQSIKNLARNAIDNLHATFARDITIIEHGRKRVITNSPNYNSIYRFSKTSEVEIEPVYHTVKARIEYENAKNNNLRDDEIDSAPQINLPNGSVVVTVDPNGFELLKDSERVEFEGRKYTISSDGNPKGFFGPQYYDFILKPIED